MNVQQDNCNPVGKYYKYKSDKFILIVHITNFKNDPYGYRVNKITIARDEVHIYFNYFEYVNLMTDYDEVTKEEFDKALVKAKKMINNIY